MVSLKRLRGVCAPRSLLSRYFHHFQGFPVYLIRIIDTVVHLHRDLLPTAETEVPQFQEKPVLNAVDCLDRLPNLLLFNPNHTALIFDPS